MISYMVRGILLEKRRNKLILTVFVSAKLREKNKDSPLNKFLPGGSMSSTRQGGTSMDEQHSMPEANSADTELIEQLQLELEEARRTIRSHETKILVLQDGWRSFWDNYSRFIQYL